MKTTLATTTMITLTATSEGQDVGDKFGKSIRSRREQHDERQELTI